MDSVDVLKMSDMNRPHFKPAETAGEVVVLLQRERDVSESGLLRIFSCRLFDSLVCHVIRREFQTNVLI